MRKSRRLQNAVTPLLLPLALFLGGAILHHGWSSYDQESPTNLSGEILKYSYDNPHGMIDLEVAEDSAWAVVLAPPSRMQRRGLPEAELEVGTAVEVLAYPRKDGTREMRAEWIIVDGDTTQFR